MRRAYDLLKSLAKKRSSMIKEKVNSIHDQLTLCLPIELVSRIFTLVIEGSGDPFSQGHESRFLKDQCSVPLILSAVCKSWRQVAFATPRLWTTVNIYIYCQEKILLQEELLSQWLERSGHHLLDMSILCPESRNRTRNIDANLAFQLLDCMKAYSTRWHRLHLIVPLRSYSIFLANLTCLPSLEYLQISTYVYEDLEVPISIPDTPLLKYFSANQISFPSFPVQWDNLTVFHLNFMLFDEVFELLRHASKLQECVLGNIQLQADDPDFPFPTTPISLPALKIFEVEFFDPVDAGFFFDHLTLPSLQDFTYAATLSTIHYPPFPADQIISLFTRSQCIVRELRLDEFGESMTDDKLIRVLEHQPSIISLSLSSASIGRTRPAKWMSDTFFQRFQTKSQPSALGATFLPCLQDLKIFGRRAFSWECFADTLDALWSRIEAIKIIDGTSNITNKAKDHINISVVVDDVGIPQTAEYIDLDTVSRLVNAEWKRVVSLEIDLMGTGRKDLISTSLAFHGIANGNELRQ